MDVGPYEWNKSKSFARAEFPERTWSGQSAISGPVSITTGSVKDGVPVRAHALNFGIHVRSS